MHEPDSSDERLMAAMKWGNTQALRTLIERWEIRLLQFVHRYVQNESVARDLVQEVFVRIYQNRSQFNDNRRFSTWMFGIAVNLCRNHHRWLSRHAEASLDTAPEPVDRGTPANQEDSREAIEALQEAIRKLPHAHRVTLLLYYYEDQSYSEIADVLSCSIRAVESRLYRARRQLAKRLGLKLGNRLRESLNGHNRIRNTSSHVLCR